MATELLSGTFPPNPQQELLPEEWDRMLKRRKSVRDYEPPKWISNHRDDVSGTHIEQSMVNHANIVFIGPVGSGKSSLIGSIFRAVNEEPHFPDKVRLMLHHPDEDSHGTMQWLETRGNPRGTIIFQDTRGDQEYDGIERSIHEHSMRGMYRDGASLQISSLFSKEWWVSRRFFWERNLSETPHSIVFVFDGSSNPFLDPESLEFFQDVFEDCTKMGYEPVIVITCLDLIYQEAIRVGESYDIQVQHKREKILQAFEDLDLTRHSIYFVTNFHEGKRGAVRVWNNMDPGFTKATKMMVDLAKDLLALSDRFIRRKYTEKSACHIL